MFDFGTSIDTNVSILTFVLIALVIISLILNNVIQNRFIPDAGITLLVGIAAGGVIEYVLSFYPDSASADLLNFNPIIFLIQLPPIIFNSGFNIDIGKEDGA